MKQAVAWNVLEYLCRLLGISTGAGLLAVGIETLLQGQFKSLALYLLLSGVAVSLWEGAFLASLLLTPCLGPLRGSRVDACRLRAKRRGAFQKFLAYGLLSVACFLSPVHVWQVLLPGTLLILTSLAYFLLSRQRKEETGDGPPEESGDPRDEAAGERPGDSRRQTSSSHRQSSPLAASLGSFFQACQGPVAFLAPSSVASRRSPADSEEQAQEMALPLRGEPEGSLAKESTSETAFILSAQV
ncbi:transmembrane protein 72 [Notechis scutatus]|uniref:Transmembrane protein 72 n=1 Tax=Notechis scutatus TaxID=8663 RepID=A0A6J1VSQ9_9SAUR|nr:transmembrane protein 72 [Notechis scutatus]